MHRTKTKGYKKNPGECIEPRLRVINPPGECIEPRLRVIKTPGECIEPRLRVIKNQENA